MQQNFAQRSALVTGSASGIGAACARYLTDAGARVIGIDRAEGRDVTDETMWEACASDLAAIDLAVINAGISAAGPIVDTSLADWRRVLAVNLDGAFLSLRAAMRAMRAHGRGGAIVVTASATAFKAEVGVGAYGASKAGLIQLARVAAKEGAPHGIRVNAIAPGGVDTPIWDGMDAFADMAREAGGRDAAIAAMGRMATPLGRYASADEIAAQIAFLLSDAAATITGAVLTSDGGYSL